MNGNNEIRDDLSALIDGALDPERQREVESAIETDPALRAEYEQLRKIDGLYAELPREAAPDDFAKAVRAAIARRENMGEADAPHTGVKIRPFMQAPRRRVFWPLAAAATVLVGFFLWSTMNMANRSGMMLSMNKTQSASKAVDSGAKEEQLYRVQVAPAETAKAAPPAAPAPPAAAAPVAPAPAPSATPAPEPAQGSVEKKGDVLAEQPAPPPSADGMPALEPLRRQDRERVLGKVLSAKKAPPETSPPSAEANVPAPAAAESATAGAAPQAAAPAGESQAEQRKVAGRVFVRSDTGWVEQSYKGEVLTPLELDSDEYKELLPTHPPLEKVAELGGTVTLRIDGVWRDLKTGRPVAESK